MITYEQLKQNPKAFKGLTGLTVDEFDNLYELFEPVWLNTEEERLNRPDRRRAIGGGAQYGLGLKTRLLMVMFWLRLYLTQETVGYLFNLHKSNVSRNGRRILQVLRQVSESEFEWPEPPKRGHGRTAEEAFRDYPELFAIVDATEQPIQRPKNDAKQRSHYSGKKKRHTRKTAILVNEQGLIRAIAPSTPGSMHDINHLRRSGLLEKIPKEVGVIGDSGFDGLHKDLPEHSVAIAHKARRNHPLTDDQKGINRELSSTRIIVENVFCHIKHFKVLAQRFRHTTDIYDDIFHVVAAIVNRRTHTRIAKMNV